jgi:uncharacterized protein YukE
MATGINKDNMDRLKVDLLDCSESINGILNRLDNCKTVIQSNVEGASKDEIVQKLDSLNANISIIKGNVNTYINVLSRIEDIYSDQDYEVASNIVKNISKLEDN